MPAGASPSPFLPITYVLPDILALAPEGSSTRVNLHYETEVKHSAAWLNSFDVFPDPTRRRAFEKMDFPWLSAVVYVEADAERYRLMADFMNWFFAYDDIADDGELPEDGRKVISDVLHRTNGETTFKAGRLFAEYVHRLLVVLGVMNAHTVLPLASGHG